MISYLILPLDNQATMAERAGLHDICKLYRLHQQTCEADYQPSLALTYQPIVSALLMSE